MSLDHSTATTEAPELVIEAGQLEHHYWADIWRYRELLVFLAMRDILVRYKQTVFGVAWAVLRPTLTMVAFTLVFSRLARLPSGDMPYPILVMAGLLPWQFFTSALTDAGNSLLGNAHMVSKVYFPRLILPASAVAVSLVDFSVACALMGLLMFWYGHVPGWAVLAFPLYVMLVALIALGAGMWIAALNVKYRDVRYVVPFLTQFGLYVSPVGFSSTVVPEKWQWLYALNPMVGVIDGVRWSISATPGPMPWASSLVSVAFAAVLIFSGLFFFRRAERSFADLV
jgi:lipopolysaccharide transport system permease protein